MNFVARRGRRGVASIVANVVMFAILFSVGTSFFVYVESENTAYTQNLVTAAANHQSQVQESLSVTTLLETDGDVGFYVTDTSILAVNVTGALVISSAGLLLKCDGVGFPTGSGCGNSTPALWMEVNSGSESVSVDTGYTYTAGTTVTVKVLTARGNSYTAVYPSPAQQSTSSQSVTVALDNLKWVQLIPQASSLVQKKFVSNCNAAACAATYGSSVTASNILVDAVSWPGSAPPSSVPTDTLHDAFTLGASSSVNVAASPALVQDKYTSNCNAATCGLAFSSNVGSGDTLVYAVGWANQAAPSTPTDTLGDTFTLGASNSVTVNPPTATVVQHRYTSNCNSATCALAYSSSVTAGNTLALGLGWPSAVATYYVPITLTNCGGSSSLSLDGSATGTITSSNSGTASLTTSKTNDVIVVVVNNEDQPNSAIRTVSSVAATGLTFAKRSSTTLGSPTYQDTEVWWAVASSALSSATITVTLSGSTDDGSIVAFGVNGANTSSPWDSNSALPATANGSGSTPSVGGVSTSSANDMLLGFQGNGEGTGTQSTSEGAGSGFTLIQNENNEGGTNSDDAAAEYEIVSSTQSSVTVAFNTATYSANYWMAIGDAIQSSSNCAATANPFQQMIAWDPATYSAYEATNLGNIRFCTSASCSTELYAWLESCSSTCSTAGSSSTSATAWVRLTSSIAANGGTLTIYMVFESTSTNFDDNYWGEAPQLSSTYGQYDNGANVFTYYVDFSGTSLPGSLTTYASSGTDTVNNGLTLNAGSTQYIHVYTSGTYSPGVLEADIQSITSSGEIVVAYDTTGPSSGGDIGFQTAYRGQDSLYSSELNMVKDVTGTGSTLGTATPTISSGVMGLEWPSTGTENLYTGYTKEISATDSAITYGSSKLDLFFYGNAASQSAAVYWLRNRVDPPSGVMPTVTFGGALSTNPNFVPITITNSQSSATSNPFQQMITWDPATYSSYEATNLGNVRFCADAACVTPLYSWLESCSATCSTGGSTSTSATAWVKLTSSIAASGGTLTIYMVFEPTSTNFDDNYWGEASILSSTYGQYDNGANVFYDYGAFQGSSIPSEWSVSGSASFVGGTSNTGGIRLVSNSGGQEGAATSSKSFSTIGACFDTSAEYNGNADDVGQGFYSSGAGTATGGYGPGTTNGNGYYASYEYYTGSEPALRQSTTTLASASSQTLPTSGTNFIYMETCASSSQVTMKYATNTSSQYAAGVYSGLTTTVTYSATISAGGSTTFIGGATGGASSYAYVFWDRIRAYPPAGVMPSTSTGSVIAGTNAPISVTDTLGDTFTLGPSQSVTSGSWNYISAIWYATAATSGSNTITATFSSAVQGTVSIYELQGYSTSSPMTSTGSSSGGSTSASVGSFTPSSNSVVIGNVETGSTSTKYTVGSGYTTVASGAGGCDASDASQGCNEYETGLGSATTTPFTLSASTPWSEAAISFAPLSSNTYYSYIWYATAGSSAADTISASFGSTVAGSVSIYELSSVTATGLLTSTGSSSSSQSSTAVTSITPTGGSVVIGNTETTSTTYTAGSGYTLSGTCSSVAGCGEYQTGVGSATTVPMSLSPSSAWTEAAVAFAPTTTNYYSYIWYATAASSGSDTVTTTFSGTTAASVTLYEITGYTTSGALSSTGSSSTAGTTASVTSFTPSSDSFILSTTEATASDTYTAGSGYTLGGTCSSVQGCSQYDAGGGGSATTVPITLSTSEPWVEAAMAFSTPFNPQSGIQVGGYPTLGVPSGASIVWEVTFTDVDPQQRSITVWPQTELAVGSAEYDGFDTDYTQAHYYIISGLNSGSTTLNAYSTAAEVTLQYDVPTTLYFAATAALGSTTQAFGTNVLTPFEAYFALSGMYSDGTLFGETIPYPYGIITEANAYSSPTAGAPGAPVTISCTTPCDFNDNYKGMVGWINSEGQLTAETTFTMTSSGNIPSGVSFNVPNVAQGYYTIAVTDYVNTVFMTFDVN